MFGRTPNLRYPLWRWTVGWLAVGTAVSGYITYKLHYNDAVVRRQRWENFFR
ncbi:unnamed protein product [Gongylonema pulchrum]|uniref:NADH dehydrogenase [ubiquinone] 1 alpha subcomplex subunit 4 n=1 Tax=Gongylonema pulchrum TaxID=637853 RepID=A0A183EQ32_9BILA|nr:unnamed protein product [Gongylonema pulchrum]